MGSRVFLFLMCILLIAGCSEKEESKVLTLEDIQGTWEGSIQVLINP